MLPTRGHREVNLSDGALGCSHLARASRIAADTISWPRKIRKVRTTQSVVAPAASLRRA